MASGQASSMPPGMTGQRGCADRFSMLACLGAHHKRGDADMGRAPWPDGHAAMPGRHPALAGRVVKADEVNGITR